MRKITNKFRAKALSEYTWRAMWWGLSILLTPFVLGMNAALLRPFLDEVVGERAATGITLALAIAVFSWVIAAVVKNLRSYKKGEHGWILWLGLAPSLLIGILWLIMVIAEIVEIISTL